MCASDEAFHEVPLGTSVQRCCGKFGSFVTFQVASLELSGEKADVKDVFSVMMGTAATLKVGNFRLPPKKGSETYQQQQNFQGNLKLYNAVINMLKAMNPGFKTGSELTVGKELVGVLSNVLYEILPTECLKRLESRGVHMSNFFHPIVGPVYSDPSKHSHSRLPQLTQVDLTGMVEKLVRVRGLPSLQTRPWCEVNAAIGDLVSGLKKYVKYLEGLTERINTMHQQCSQLIFPKQETVMPL